MEVRDTVRWDWLEASPHHCLAGAVSVPLGIYVGPQLRRWRSGPTRGTNDLRMWLSANPTGRHTSGAFEAGYRDGREVQFCVAAYWRLPWLPAHRKSEGAESVTSAPMPHTSISFTRRKAMSRMHPT